MCTIDITGQNDSRRQKEVDPALLLDNFSLYVSNTREMTLPYTKYSIETLLSTK